jgi:hypothetical protein
LPIWERDGREIDSYLIFEANVKEKIKKMCSGRQILLLIEVKYFRNHIDGWNKGNCATKTIRIWITRIGGGLKKLAKIPKIPKIPKNFKISKISKNVKKVKKVKKKRPKRDEKEGQNRFFPKRFFSNKFPSHQQSLFPPNTCVYRFYRRYFLVFASLF